MATRQEYYGYLPPSQTLDLGKLTADLSKTISGIGERRTLEKEELDKIQTDNAKIIRDTELGKSQTFQTMTLNGAQGGVQKLNEWNKMLKAGQLSPKEYKQRMNTMMENWGTFANTVKTYDARMAEIQKQQQDGNASGIAVSSNEYFAQMSSLKDKQVFIDESGNMSMGKVDPNTGQLDPQSVESFRSMALPNNMVFDKVPLDKTVNDTVKLWKPYIEENGLSTIESVKSNKDLARKMADLTGGLTSNPRLTASILVDNTGSGYDVYFGQEDFNNKLGSMIQTENEARRISGEGPMSQAEQSEFAKEASGKLIEMRKDSTDTYQPVITEDQLARAKEAIEVAVSLQLGFKSTQDELPRPAKGDSSTEKPKNLDNAEVLSIRKAWANGDVEALRSLSGGKYFFKYAGDNKTMLVYKKDPDSIDGQDEQPIKVSDFMQAGDYFNYTNNSNWRDYVDYSRDKYGDQRKKSTTTKPKAGGSTTTTKPKFN
jgi:hypothetical protein